MTTDTATAPAAAPAEAPAPAPSPAAPAPAPAAEAPAPAPAAAKETLFSKPTDPPAPAAEKTEGAAPEWLPEKFRVLTDGKFDADASSKKLAESYANLEKHKGQPAPAKVEDYTDSPVPEEFKDVPLDPVLTRSFREGAHKAGLSQPQLDFVMGEYFKLVPSLLNAQAAATADEARAELSKVWSTPAELQSNMTAAERAVAAVPAELQEQIRTEFGTNALFWQFAAQFGKEVGEDRPAAPAGGSQGVTDVEALMRSEAYRNAKHPDHAKVSAQVSQAFSKRVGDAEVMG
ncbi:hypothetical protein [Hydrogenophaga sp.]|uniref:hypothetical protein n=1 Tax=Hydrogenophaga sp. TaxID=1904254 RepID=UPI003F6F5C17